eukprot:Em0023g242a
MAEPSAPTHEAPPAYFPGDFKSPPPQGYPPPPQGYPPPQNYQPPQQNQPLITGYAPAPPQYQSTATVVVIQPTCFRDRPVLVTDSNGQQVMTRVEYHSGTLTWLICCLVCWLTGCWCIALIPFCIDDAKDVHHFTPTDNRLVGIYKRL